MTAQKEPAKEKGDLLNQALTEELDSGSDLNAAEMSEVEGGELSIQGITSAHIVMTGGGASTEQFFPFTLDEDT